jgi:hypothetical protein
MPNDLQVTTSSWVTDPSAAAALDVAISAADQSAEQAGNLIYDESSGINADTIGGDDVKASLIASNPSPRQGRPATIVVARVVHEQPEKNGSVATRHEATNRISQKFYITDADMPQADRFSIIPTFGEEPDVLLTFGKAPHIWTFSGVLRNEWGKNAWYREFDTFYRENLRASLMAQRQEVALFRLGDIQMEGYILSLNINQTQQSDDAWVQFGFQMYVRDYRFTTVRDTTGYVGASNAGSADEMPGGDRYHTVVRGDTVDDLARTYGTTRSAILRLNPQITNVDYIEIGQRLLISSRPDPTEPTPTPVSGDNDADTQTV